MVCRLMSGSGCVLSGQTEKQAEKNLRESLCLFLTSCIERGTLEAVLKECGFRHIPDSAPEIKSQERYLSIPLHLLSDKAVHEQSPHNTDSLESFGMYLVEEACASVQLTYSDVILRLLKQWITQKTDLINEPDADFVASVREVLSSEHVQQAMQKLGENYIPHRIYPNAIKASWVVV